MPKFSLSTLLKTVAVAALLFSFARIGFWAFVFVTAYTGAILFACAPALVANVPNFVLPIAGAFGGGVGCTVGTFLNIHTLEPRTGFLTLLEYQEAFQRHLVYFLGAMLSAIILGAVVGVAISCYRDQIALKS